MLTPAATMTVARKQGAAKSDHSIHRWVAAEDRNPAMVSL